MEWFDLKSVAALFGVTPTTVRKWVSSNKLPAVRLLFNGYDPITHRRVPARKWHINRVHLEDFFMRRWGAQGMTLADLIVAKQAVGAITVWATPEIPPEVDRVTLGAQTLKALEDLQAKRYAGQTRLNLPPVPPRERRLPRDYIPPVQLELFS